MSLSNPKTAISEQDLKDFYDKIKPFLAPKTYAGFTPIGTVISIFGESAPANYLICDGATYNVADYPELCAHLWSLTTNSQYKVSGDSTKFKVPDLRGEFLRGTGANSHGNGGNGTTVGVHQDSTTICNTAINNSTTKTVYFRTPDKTTNVRMTTNEDKANLPTVFTNVADTQVTVASYIDRSSSTTQPASYSVRPTNTSVLFCIATKNIYLDPKNDYSTEEKVIGTWIDGKTLYQKTISISEVTIQANNNWQSLVQAPANIETLIDCKCINLNDGVYKTIQQFTYSLAVTSGYISVINLRGTSFTITGLLTIQYTKTTT